MDHNYYSHTLAVLLEKFSSVCAWFDDLGFHYAQTRYGIYDKLFKNLKKDFAVAKEDDDALRKFKERFENAYLEINEIVRIQSDLCKLSTSDFFAQIEKVLSGQELRNQADDDAARDFLFELSTACRFLRAGYPVSLTGICDAAVAMKDGKTLFVESKRIKSIRKIRKNVSKASAQIVQPQLKLDTSSLELTDT